MRSSSASYPAAARNPVPPGETTKPARPTGPTAQSKKDVPTRQPFGENMPKGPLQLMISINEQHAVLYSNGIRVAETKVSTGTASHPTPTGVFSIIQKNRWHRSNLYGNAPMFYMHRLTWSGIALHEGHLPGFAASHGCIRMPTDFVSRLWNVSNMGMRVVVARPQLAPQDFAHAKLFNPAPKPTDTQRTSEAPKVCVRRLRRPGRGPFVWRRRKPSLPFRHRIRRTGRSPPRRRRGRKCEPAGRDGRRRGSIGHRRFADAADAPPRTTTRRHDRPATPAPAAQASRPRPRPSIVQAAAPAEPARRPLHRPPRPRRPPRQASPSGRRRMHRARGRRRCAPAPASR